MGQLDASIVTLALPHIGANLHASTGAVRWVALSYMLVLTATLVAVGHLADRFGRKLLYTCGFLVFTLGSALCGLAPSLDWLIAARILQGLGAAMLQANSVALIANALERRELARGLGVQGAAQAAGLALGPVLGGLLLALGGWRLVFLVNVPAGVIGVALGWVLLPRSRSTQDRVVRSAPRRARACRHRRTSRAGARGPGELGLVDLPALARGLAGAGAAYLVMFGALYVLTYSLAARHVSVVAAGLQLAALPVALGLAAPAAGRLAGRDGDKQDAAGRVLLRALTVGGLLLATAGLLALAVFHGLAGRLTGLTLLGAGLGAFIPVNNATVMSAAPRERAGVSSGILNTTRSLAAAAGVAIAGLLYTALARPHAVGAPGSPASSDRGLTVALLTLAAFALAGASLQQHVKGIR
jgi:MFS family permease